MAHGSSVSARDARRQRARFQVLFTSWLSGYVAAVRVSIILQQYTRFADVRRPSIRRCARHVTPPEACGLRHRGVLTHSDPQQFEGLWRLAGPRLHSMFGLFTAALGQAIIFLSCGFYLSIFFFSSPNLSGRRMDVYHTSTHDVVLVRI